MSAGFRMCMARIRPPRSNLHPLLRCRSRRRIGRSKFAACSPPSFPSLLLSASLLSLSCTICILFLYSSFTPSVAPPFVPVLVTKVRHRSDLLSEILSACGFTLVALALLLAVSDHPDPDLAPAVKALLLLAVPDLVWDATSKSALKIPVERVKKNRRRSSHRLFSGRQWLLVFLQGSPSCCGVLNPEFVLFWAPVLFRRWVNSFLGLSLLALDRRPPSISGFHCCCVFLVLPGSCRLCTSWISTGHLCSIRIILISFLFLTCISHSGMSFQWYQSLHCITMQVKLVDWLKMMVGSRRFEEVVDPNIEIKPSIKAPKGALLTALRCIDPDSDKRPRMSQVVRMLESEEYPLSKEDRRHRRTRASSIEIESQRECSDTDKSENPDPRSERERIFKT